MIRRITDRCYEQATPEVYAFFFYGQILVLWATLFADIPQKEEPVTPRISFYSLRQSTLNTSLESSVGTAVAQWLRCCATNRKVTGSIPDGVIGIFHRHNPSDRTMALGSTQPLTEMSTRRISWG